MVVLGVQHVHQRAVAQLASGAGGVEPRGAGLQAVLQCGHAGLARLPTQPGSAHLLGHLLAGLFQLCLGLVQQACTFAGLGAAHAAVVQRNVDLHTDHGIGVAVAGRAEFAPAAQPVEPGLCDQVDRHGIACAALAQFLLGHAHTMRGQLHLRVGGLRGVDPGLQRFAQCLGLRGQLRHGQRQAGAVGQRLAYQVALQARGLDLRAHAGQRGVRLVRVGHGHVAQLKTVVRLGGGARHRFGLALGHAQLLLRHGEGEVALGGAQQQFVAGGAPGRVAHLSAQMKLRTGGVAPTVDQRLLRNEVGARGQSRVHRGGEVHALGRAEAGRRELRALHARVAGAQAGAQAQHHVGAPQRLGLFALGLRRRVLGTGHGQRAVVLLGSAPHGEQVLRGGRQRGQPQQADGQPATHPGGLHAHAAFSPPNSS